jgi:hypothetical protein
LKCVHIAYTNKQYRRKHTQATNAHKDEKGVIDMSVTALEHVETTLHQPAIVTRECLMTNPRLRDRLARLGFSRVLRVESSENVLAITSDTAGEIRAAGILLMTPHLMAHRETSLPEIHVRTGIEDDITVTEDGKEAITWSIDEISVQAASMTVAALRNIAHRRDEWRLKTPLVGIPPSTAGGPIWGVSRTLPI